MEGMGAQGWKAKGFMPHSQLACKGSEDQSGKDGRICFVLPESRFVFLMSLMEARWN